MASEYLKWKYRDVKPETRRTLTPEERRRNWWHYHKWHVVLGAVLLLAALDIGRAALGIGTVRADYQLAYVGSASLPEDTVAAVEDALATLGEDLNGDGRVRVQLNQYVIGVDEGGDASYAAANRVRLMADLEVGESAFFLLETPETFQKDYEVLCRADGSAAAADEAGYYVAWRDCPVLAALPLGGYETIHLGARVSGDSQALLGALSLARRSPDEAYAAPYAAFWNTLTEGAGT
ncbi:MAG: hypothetical protein K6G54_00355 [Oscillospiraceae bacterium]|nr:hypothetical protein [Oscillospiraceae bacterium]